MTKLYRNKSFRRFTLLPLLLLIFVLSSRVSFAQCPPNIDFEFGDFTGWRCYTGSVTNNTGVVVWNLP
ncbi:MAG TPA: hypothetical protein VKH37_01480, partial [Ferruginibacter sp.]|nr:hypothetical protein [Ferruginibacter sp.]